MERTYTVSHVNKTISLLAAAGLGLMVSAAAVSADLNKAIEERLKPVGELCMSGDDCAAAPVAAAAAEPRSGAQVYETKCFTCHASGAAGAPKLGDAADWSNRVGKGIDTLYTNAISGFNGMPAKGLCMDCSDDEIKAAVDHMVDGSK
ncbi:cytochrome c5 family protein [Pseudomaricurvus alkylphenolicus]|uniref:c-type cytochrome n=1 Tax=Pseudomaricurvus alkylphenolicus TaxID=1306991 RepID=UPI0014239C3A|nr:cytochrome c5 family protein [Pseudomaricurvus alkylphenolicus]